MEKKESYPHINEIKERMYLQMAKKEIKTDLWVASQLDKCKIQDYFLYQLRI